MIVHSDYRLQIIDLHARFAWVVWKIDPVTIHQQDSLHTQQQKLGQSLKLSCW